MRDPIRILTLLLVAVASSPAALRAQAAVDTVISIDAPGQLEIENFQGSVTIGTWDRNAVRVVAEGPRDAIRIHGAGGSVSIQTDMRRGPREVVYRLSVPLAMDLSVHGVDTDVTIRDTRGRVQAHTVNGDILVEGGRGVIELNSVQGEVTLSGAQGNAEISSVNDAIRVTGFQGNLKATTVNGEVVLSGVESGSVESTTVNGSIDYQGTIRPDGWYRFNTHNGEVSVAIPAGTGADIEVNTFNGDFQADFPVTVDPSREGKNFNFTLGSGGARIELSAFNGTIRLHRSGQSGGGS